MIYALSSVYLRVLCGKSIRALLAKVAWILKWFETHPQDGKSANHAQLTAILSASEWVDYESIE